VGIDLPVRFRADRFMRGLLMGLRAEENDAISMWAGKVKGLVSALKESIWDDKPLTRED